MTVAKRDDMTMEAELRVMCFDYTGQGHKLRTGGGL